MLLEEVLPLARNDKGIRLKKWKEDVFIKIQFPDVNSKMTAPYFYVTSRFGLVPWNPTQIELLSTEWELYAE
jgi:hypothetical protein